MEKRLLCEQCFIYVPKGKICPRCKKDVTQDYPDMPFQPQNSRHLKKLRRCYECEKNFMSVWSGDRHCKKCKERQKPFELTYKSFHDS